MFFRGYGVKTCGSSAKYLMKNCNREIADFIDGFSYCEEDDYFVFLDNLAILILDFIKNNTDKGNSIDCVYDYDTESESSWGDGEDY